MLRGEIDKVRILSDIGGLSVFQGKTTPPARLTPTTITETPLPEDKVSAFSPLAQPLAQPLEVALPAATPAKTYVSAVPTSISMEVVHSGPENDNPFMNPVSACLVGHFDREIEAHPKAKDALLKLAPEQQKQVRDLIGHESLRDASSPSPKYTSTKAVENLVGLLASGRLLAKDSQGSTTLDHLVQLQNEPLDAGFTSKRGVLFAELTANLNCAGETHQYTHGTCSPTSLEYLHVKKEPSDYARVMVGLLSEGGEVKFKGGETFERNCTGIKDDSSGRSNIDRVYQSSMMGHACQNRALYNNYDDSFYSLSHRKFRESGLFNTQSNHLMTQIFGKTTKVMEYDNNPKTFQADVKRALNLDQAVWVSLKWDPNPDARDSNHALAVEKWENGKVYLRNPHGEQEDGGTNGPSRSLQGDKGEIVLDQEVFFKHLNSAIRPERPFYHVWANRVRFFFGGEEGVKKGPN